MKLTTKLWIVMAVLIILSPLGLFLPDHFKAGSAWGEWAADEIRDLAGYVPQGLEKLSEVWKAPLPDYAFGGWEEKGLPQLSLAYIISALAGILIVAGLIYAVCWILMRKKD